MSLISHAVGAGATAAGAGSARALVSAGGCCVVFQSAATDLVAGFAGGGQQVYLHDRESGTTALISHAAGSATTGANAASTPLDVSADGRVVLFLSAATDLVAPFGNADGLGEDVFLHDRTTGATTLVSRSVASPTTTGNRKALGGALSADGRYVLLTTYATNPPGGFFQGNTSGQPDVFLYDRVSGSFQLVSRTAASSSTGGNGISYGIGLSADGRHAVFASDATDLVAGFVGAAVQTYLYDRDLGTNLLVSHAPGSLSSGGNNLSVPLGLSADGRVVLFISSASNLVPGFLDVNGPALGDVFVYDRQNGQVTLISHSTLSATQGSNDASFLSGGLSADGRFVLFESAATDLVPGFADANGSDTDLFVHDRATGSTTLVTRATGTQTTGSNGAIETGSRLSADARYVLFASTGTDLVPDFHSDNGAGLDVFLHDRVKQTTTLVTRAVGTPGTGGNRSASASALSADGRVAVFMTAATDLVPGYSGDGLASQVFAWTPTLAPRGWGATGLLPRVRMPGAAPGPR